MAVRAMGSGAPISIGNPSSQPNASINVKQAVNGSPAVVIQRNTDSSPTGDLVSVLNAAGSTVAYIDVFGDMVAPSLTATGNAINSGAGTVSIGGTTATTATTGANGAVPAQVAGYIIINVAGTAMKIPYFNT